MSSIFTTHQASQVAAKRATQQIKAALDQRIPAESHLAAVGIDDKRGRREGTVLKRVHPLVKYRWRNPGIASKNLEIRGPKPLVAEGVQMIKEYQRKAPQVDSVFPLFSEGRARILVGDYPLAKSALVRFKVKTAGDVFIGPSLMFDPVTIDPSPAPPAATRVFHGRVIAQNGPKSRVVMREQVAQAERIIGDCDTATLAQNRIAPGNEFRMTLARTARGAEVIFELAKPADLSADEMQALDARFAHFDDVGADG